LRRVDLASRGSRKQRRRTRFLADHCGVSRPYRTGSVRSATRVFALACAFSFLGVSVRAFAEVRNVIDGGSKDGYSSTVLVPTAGRPIIVYRDTGDEYVKVKVARCADTSCSSWTTETVVASGRRVGDTGIGVTLDESNVPSIAFSDKDSDLLVARCESEASCEQGAVRRFLTADNDRHGPSIGWRPRSTRIVIRCSPCERAVAITCSPSGAPARAARIRPWRSTPGSSSRGKRTPSISPFMREAVTR